jgi:hypothetical protein
VLRRQVLNDYDGELRIRREGSKESGDGFQPACGRSNPDDRERFALGRFSLVANALPA